jgi:hypothetical protein
MFKKIILSAVAVFILYTVTLNTIVFYQNSRINPDVHRNVRLSRYNTFDSEGFIPSSNYRVIEFTKENTSKKCIDYGHGHEIFDKYYISIQTYVLYTIPYYTKNLTCDNTISI